MAANFTEFGKEGSAKSWAATLNHAETARSSVVRSLCVGFREAAMVMLRAEPL
jgi:hypothetical protein